LVRPAKTARHRFGQAVKTRARCGLSKQHQGDQEDCTEVLRFAVRRSSADVLGPVLGARVQSLGSGYGRICRATRSALHLRSLIG